MLLIYCEYYVYYTHIIIFSLKKRQFFLLSLINKLEEVAKFYIFVYFYRKTVEIKDNSYEKSFCCFCFLPKR